MKDDVPPRIPSIFQLKEDGTRTCRSFVHAGFQLKGTNLLLVIHALRCEESVPSERRTRF